MTDLTSDRKNQKFLIIEPDSSGHRMRYVARIAAGAIDHGFDVVIVTSADAAEHPELASFKALIQIREFTSLSGFSLKALIKLQLSSRAHYIDYADEFGADRVLIPWGDSVDKSFALLGGGNHRWEFILLRSFFHHSAMSVNSSTSRRSDKVRAWFFRRLLRRKDIHRILTLDELLPKYARSNGWRGAEKIRFIPDPPQLTPAGDRKAARQRLNLAADVPVLLIYGALTARKGVQDAILAFVHSDKTFNGVIFLVGYQDEEINSLLREADATKLRDIGRLLEINRYVDEQTEADVFAASDVVWLGYRNFQGSSGVLVQSARADRPVIACSEGLIGWRTKRHGLGPVLESRDPVSVRLAFLEALKLRDDEIAAERRRAFADDNREDAFVSAILAP